MDNPLATLSIDCDNLWSYLRTHGDDDWLQYPSFLERALPRILEFTGDDLRVTLFIVGRDAENRAHQTILAALGASHHEIGNHSHDHRPDFHIASRADVAADIARAESAIEAATGVHPRGFRGPSFRLSRAILEVLLERDYAYDASTFPTFAGPLARAYHFATSRLSDEQKIGQKDLFGSFRDGLRPLRPYRWDLGADSLLEVPVTTMPVMRIPMHMTYINFLADRSPRLAEAWFRAGIALCRARRIAPSLLLHATDFVGSDDPGYPTFMPGMQRTSSDKIALLGRLVDRLQDRFSILPLGEFAERAERDRSLPSIQPRFDAHRHVSHHHP